MTQSNRSAGRPEIGNAVHIRLGGLLDHVDTWAQTQGLGRPEAIRALLEYALNTKQPPASAPWDEIVPVDADEPPVPHIRVEVIDTRNAQTDTQTLRHLSEIDPEDLPEFVREQISEAWGVTLDTDRCEEIRTSVLQRGHLRLAATQYADLTLPETSDIVIDLTHVRAA
jgi:hypothetical protein